jgi:hypothetical protein
MGAELRATEGIVRASKRVLWGLRPVRTLHHLRRARRDAALLDPRRPQQVPVLVHQMAKVGSSTVQATLEALDPPRPACIKVHFLSRDGVRRERALDRRVGGPLYVSYYGAIARSLAARLRRVGGHLQVPIISLVRDPIAREVSGLFQLPELAGGGVRDRQGRIDVERALAWLESLFARGEACLGADRWFDEELRDVFGIDVFAQPFPRERGYAVLGGRRARVLLLRTEDLDRTLGPALQEFLDLPKPPALVRANQRAQSEQAPAYREVLDRFRLEPAVVEEIYARRLSRHFYPDAMLEAFHRRWTGSR